VLETKYILYTTLYKISGG